MDSGNVWRCAVSEDFFKTWQPQQQLREVSQTTVGTAKQGAALQVLGETQEEVDLAIPAAGDLRYRTRPVVIKGLAMDFNISGPFMQRHHWDQLHSQSCLSINGKKVPLHHDHRNSTLMYVAHKVRVPAGCAAKVTLRPERGRDALKENELGLLLGPEAPRGEAQPVRAALVRGNPDLATEAYLFNMSQNEQFVKEGAYYGTLEGVPSGEVESLSSLQAPRAKEEERPEKTWPAGKKSEWLKRQFDLENKPCLKNQPKRLEQALNLLMDFWEFFSFDGSFGRTHLMKHRILTEDVPPIKNRYRPINPTLEPNLKEQLNTWLKHGVIEASESPWSSNLVAVAKKDGRIRWCVDWR